MNESIRLVFERDGHELAVDGASADGITLFGETSAWPRRVSMMLRPVSPGIKAKLPAIRRRHNLAANEFRLAIRRLAGSGHVLLSGLDREGLPDGTWELSLNVYPFGTHRAGRIRVPKNGQAIVRVPLGRDPGAIVVKPQSHWDPEIARVLDSSELDEDPRSAGDKENGASWALNETRRARRRACAFNVLAVCRELNLTRHIRLVFFAEVDRLYTRVEPSLLAQLDEARFRFEGTPSHPIHWRIFDALEGVDASRWELLSFRQIRNPSLQVVVAREKPELLGEARPVFAELDIDIGNPRKDLVGFFVHLAELAHPGRTNHIHLWSQLKSLPAGRFLAYDPIHA